MGPEKAFHWVAMTVGTSEVLLAVMKVSCLDLQRVVMWVMPTVELWDCLMGDLQAAKSATYSVAERVLAMVAWTVD